MAETEVVQEDPSAARRQLLLGAWVVASVLLGSLVGIVLAGWLVWLVHELRIGLFHANGAFYDLEKTVLYLAMIIAVVSWLILHFQRITLNTAGWVQVGVIFLAVFIILLLWSWVAVLFALLVAAVFVAFILSIGL